MKKYIWILIAFLVIGFVIFISLNFMKNNKYENNTNNTEKDLIENDANVNEVVCVKVIEETEGGYVNYKTEDKELIKEIVDVLENIKIGDKTNIAYSDMTRKYILEFANGTTLEYSFQGNYYHKDNENYKIYNYEKLNKIKIPKEENK